MIKEVFIWDKIARWVFWDSQGYERAWIGQAFAAGAVAAILAFIFGAILAFVNHTDHVSCLRLHENTGLPTRYERSGLDGECYIQPQEGGLWIPEDNWHPEK